ncbi:nuclear transport factor 2 family protein [Shewanella sp.]|uniref:nuclear transport factor 2 family protein n=1 Tax=Shewanella sp. TaxID=50422 RepID=UPI0035635B34
MNAKLQPRGNEQEISAQIQRLMELYRHLNANNLELLDDVYSNDVVFCDPVHRIEGLVALKTYFVQMYQDLRSINFTFHQVMDDGQHAMLVWTMAFSHPKLASGKLIRVDGVSQIAYDQQIEFHRDFFDLGAMVYEHIPGLGALLRLLKRRIGQGQG